MSPRQGALGHETREGGPDPIPKGFLKSHPLFKGFLTEPVSCTTDSHAWRRNKYTRCSKSSGRDAAVEHGPGRSTRERGRRRNERKAVAVGLSLLDSWKHAPPPQQDRRVLCHASSLQVL